MNEYNLFALEQTLFWCSFALSHVTISLCHWSKVSLLFPYSSKSFLNFRLFSTRLLLKWFLIKIRVVLHSIIYDIS